MPTLDPRMTPPPAPFAPDGVKRFGKYFLVRKLAEGGMAEIFLAKQVGAEGFERNVVIKRMLPHLSALPDFVGMFLDEARLAARLGHPNVVQIHDLGLVDGCYFIGMEYLAGEDFSTVVRRAAARGEYVPLAVVLKVIIDAAHGLHFAHEFTDEAGKRLNIVHRDISPSNLLVTYQGVAKVLDFGIAKAESRVTQTTAGVVKGKYLYMSPEQARGEPVDARADVFALGVCLYEALTNTRPFAKDNDLAVLNAVLRCEFARPARLRPDLPPELERIVLRAMSADREARYPTAGALANDLEQFQAANTSSSGGTQVASYLKSLFGEEQLARKTRIPTLQGLAEAGVAIPGRADEPAFEITESPAARDPVSRGDARTQVYRGPNEPAAPGKRARAGLLAGLVMAVAALAVGGFFAYRHFQTPPPPRSRRSPSRRRPSRLRPRLPSPRPPSPPRRPSRLPSPPANRSSSPQRPLPLRSGRRRSACSR